MGKAEFPFGPVCLEAWELNSTPDFESLRLAVGAQSSHIPHLPDSRSLAFKGKKYAERASKGRLWMQEELQWIKRLKVWEIKFTKGGTGAAPPFRWSLSLFLAFWRYSHCLRRGSGSTAGCTNGV